MDNIESFIKDHLENYLNELLFVEYSSHSNSSWRSANNDWTLLEWAFERSVLLIQFMPLELTPVEILAGPIMANKKRLV